MGLWNYITGTTPQDEQDANLEHQKQLFNEAVQRRIDGGTLTSDQENNLNSYVSNLQDDNVDAAAQQGFVEGAKEGLNNVLDAPGKVIGAAGDASSQLLGGILKNIPWWAYVAVAVVAFVYLGGLVLVKGAFKKV